MENDCIYKIVLLHLMKEKLHETKLAYGEQQFGQAMGTMDSTVAKQLMTLVSWQSEEVPYGRWVEFSSCRLVWN